MNIEPDKKVFDVLDNFFATKTIQSVNRDTFTVCNLQDIINKTNKITISIVFMRDWDGIEYDKYDQVLVPNKGAVLIFPSYWLSIPKELALEHFISVINKFYNEYISIWFGSANNSGFGSGVSGNMNYCGCNSPCNLV